MREEITVGWKNYIFWSFKFVLLTRYLGNKPRVIGNVIKYKGFLDQLNNYELSKDSIPHEVNYGAVCIHAFEYKDLT
jgi:hypothetical protein